jgi:hypothetical protein
MTSSDILKPRLRAGTGAGPGSVTAGARIRGFEATQAIQNMMHEVRLISGKPAVIRVYLEPHGLLKSMHVRGELVVSPRPGAPGTYIASSNVVIMEPDEHPTLGAQRRDASLSLNFLLDSPPPGPMVVKLKRLSGVSGGGDVPVSEEGNELNVTFSTAPVLRLRVLGIRYKDRRSDPPKSYAPDSIHFDHLRSYLRRTYPVSRIEWSQAVIDAPMNFVPPFSGETLPNGEDPLWDALRRILHTHMLVIRQSDMKDGWDPRTHYYGLVADDSGFFRGAANDVPSSPAPNTVAVGPCGQPNGSFLWDTDHSYGDWYGAHELAHTFGREHPGYCKQQDKYDIHFPYANGAISDAIQDCMGFDVGDAALSIPMRAYPHEQWCDFMTYCNYQWISKHTFDGIYNRLVAEDKFRAQD